MPNQESQPTKLTNLELALKVVQNSKWSFSTSGTSHFSQDNSRIGCSLLAARPDGIVTAQFHFSIDALSGTGPEKVHFSANEFEGRGIKLNFSGSEAKVLLVEAIRKFNQDAPATLPAGQRSGLQIETNPKTGKSQVIDTQTGEVIGEQG